MRILVVSNYYPPHYIGGYELGCRDVVDALKARGHQVLVLTSTYMSGKVQQGDIHRYLELTQDARNAGPGLSGARAIVAVEAQNQKAFSDACAAFRPDLVYFWNLSDLSISLVFIAEQKDLPIIFFVSDHWFANWESDVWYSLLSGLSTRPLLKRLIWRFIQFGWAAKGIVQPMGGFSTRYTQFCSNYLRVAALDAGKAVDKAEVIHWAVHLADFPCKHLVQDPRRLLYVGQVVPHKGVHTVIEALAIVRKSLPHLNVTLTVAGGTVAHMDDYRQLMHARVRELGLEDAVCFKGSVARETLSAVYQEHDVLVFPSCWQEPFAITPLEAMASGLPVIATTTGGSAEIFREGQNALTFPAEDAQTCADQIIRLFTEPGLYGTLSGGGRTTVTQQFQFTRMEDEVEKTLCKALDPEAGTDGRVVGKVS